MDPAHLADLIARNRRAGIVIDTKPLTLLVVGMTSRHLVGQYKHARDFEEVDFDILLALVEEFDERIATPCVLGEASNWLDKRDDLMETLAAYVETSLEVYHPTAANVGAVHRADYRRLGVTDLSVARAALERQCLTVTTDVVLVQHLSGLGLDVINFNHLRPVGAV